MKKLFQWRMPPDYLREVRDATPFKSFLKCLISGLLFGAFASFCLSYLLWKTRSPFPMELLYFGFGVVFVATILRYLLMPYFSPSVVLLNENIYLKYERTTYKYQFANITECRMQSVVGKTSHYTLLSVKSDLTNEPAFFRRRLNEKIKIGIPDSINLGQVEQILRSGGVKVLNDSFK